MKDEIPFLWRPDAEKRPYWQWPGRFSPFLGLKIHSFGVLMRRNGLRAGRNKLLTIPS
jgi:hypothetical protein